MSSNSNKRIAKNTLLLYFRMLITMGVSLYTVRIVLNTLGVEDYGLYNVVGGVVALLSFLPGSMASATQRFFSHALGQKDQDKLNRFFGVNSLIYLGIGFGALIILYTAGIWFVDTQMQVPEGRLDSVVSLFYIVVGTFVLTILKSPLMAIIIAHEDMKIYAYMAIVDAMFKLAAVFLLVHLSGDKIVNYGFLLFIVALIETVFYIGICFRRYEECKLRNFRWDSNLAKEVVGFTGWTLFGQMTTVARGAAVTILLNQYFNPVIVAARAIAVNIASQSNMLASQFNTSLYPPIIKAYAANEKEEMFALVINGSKATFFLMWIIALPIFIEMDGILKLWLKNPPNYSIEFARLTLVESLIFAISLPLTTAARAPGKMAAYESILGTLQLSILFISWFLINVGYGPQSVFYSAIGINLIMFIVRLEIVSRLTDLPVFDFLKRTIPAIFKVIILSSTLSAIVAFFMPNEFGFLISSVMFIFIISLLSIYFLGLTSLMRRQLYTYVIKKYF